MATNNATSVIEVRPNDHVVWSPDRGGCLMIRRFINGRWVNWSSFDEREYPNYDDAARLAVDKANAAFAWAASK